MNKRLYLLGFAVVNFLEAAIALLCLGQWSPTWVMAYACWYAKWRAK